MIVGIGLDLCEIERMARAIEREHFVDRVFTAKEAERIRDVPPARAAQIAAGLFAAKEAASKALGTGIAGFGPADIEVLPDPAGCPVCTLCKGALERAKVLCGSDTPRVWVSITHEKGMAAATAIIEK